MPERKTPRKRVAGTVKKKGERKTPGKEQGRNSAGKPHARPVNELLPELLAKALARHDDFIVTCETDPDADEKTIHIIAGRFVTPCMLRKLIGQAESQRDEGGILISRKWK